jgi:hypothetical protein
MMKGNDGPDHLDRHRLVEIGRLVANRLAVLPDRIEHDREHGHEDHRAQDHHEVVQPVLLFGDQVLDCSDRRPWRTEKPDLTCVKLLKKEPRKEAPRTNKQAEF